MPSPDLAEESETPQSSSQVAKDLVSGAAGGIAQVLIGQPFDIVKVRLQTTTQYTGALDAARQIYSHEGPLAFYKGTLTPLIGIGACVSVQFGAFNFARRFFENRNPSSSTLSYGQFYAAGAFAGVTNSVLSGPIEHVRIRLQTQPHVANPADRLYRGPIHCIQTLVRQAGVAHGLYRGQAVTVLREATAYGAWFLTYEYLMAADIARRGLKDRKEVEAYRLAFYGGCAGEVLWLASYPFDVVKSKMQADGLRVGAASASAKSPGAGATLSAAAAQGARQGVEEALESTTETVSSRTLGAQKYKSMSDCFAQTWAKEGAAGFWKGIGPTLLRAMPVSAATFAVAEMTMRLIS